MLSVLLINDTTRARNWGTIYLIRDSGERGVAYYTMQTAWFSTRAESDVRVALSGIYDPIGTLSLDELPAWSKIPRQIRIGGLARFESGAEWITEDARGWPARSLLGRIIAVDDVAAHGLAITQDWGILLDQPQVLNDLYRAKVLPLRPLWWGLIVNATFGAAMSYVCIATIIAIRKLLRRRHGCCGQCGYDLSTSPRDGKCPECGEKCTHDDLPKDRVIPDNE